MNATIHILDDDPAVRRSLDRLLRSAGYMTKMYSSAFALLDAGAEEISGCILLDVRMPDLDGIQTHDRLRGNSCPVILMTGYADVDMAVDALKAGAVDFLEKPFCEEKLLGAIERALQQGKSREIQDVAHDAAARIARLSPRERDVLEALLVGQGHKAIAHKLGISTRTVELHRARMLSRLGTSHLADAIRLAVLAELATGSGEGNVVGTDS